VNAAVCGEGGLDELDQPLLDLRRGNHLHERALDGRLDVLVTEQAEDQLLAAALQRLDCLLRSYLHEVGVLQSRYQQVQDVIHKLLLLDYTVHELQSLMPNVFVRKDRPQEVLRAR
jgi:hypothetical protein